MKNKNNEFVSIVRTHICMVERLLSMKTRLTLRRGFPAMMHYLARMLQFPFYGVFMIGLSVVAGGVSSNTLSIYLLSGPTDKEISKVRLESAPILADRDFVWFNTNDHSFAIKAETAKRLCRYLKKKDGFEEPRVRGNGRPCYGMDWRDRPFVLEAFGERVYQGVLVSFYTTIIYGEPMVVPQGVFIETNSTNDVVFDILLFRNIPDPRNDNRILEGVKQLFPRTVSKRSQGPSESLVSRWQAIAMNSTRQP